MLAQGLVAFPQCAGMSPEQSPGYAVEPLEAGSALLRTIITMLTDTIHRNPSMCGGSMVAPGPNGTVRTRAMATTSASQPNQVGSAPRRTTSTEVAAKNTALTAPYARSAY